MKALTEGTFRAVLLTSFFVLMMNFPSQKLYLEEKTLIARLLKQFLKSLNTDKVAKITLTKI